MHHRLLIRSACRAHNSYNPAAALRAAFGTTTRRYDSSTQESTSAKDEPLPSQWESTGWEPLQTNPIPESPRRPDPELIEEEDSAVDREASINTVPVPTSPVRRIVLGSPAVWPSYSSRVKPDAWQDGIKVLSDRLHEISDRKQKWTQNLPDNARQRLRNEVFNYEPCNVAMREVDLELPIPWLLPEGRLNVIGNVTTEIKQFASWAEPTENERYARKAVAKETMETIYGALGEEEKDRVCMEVQGSENTGLALPWSDIDIRIWEGGDPPPSWHLSAPRLLHRLRAVGEAMRNSDKWTEIEVRDSFYPILVARHKDSGVDIQIVASLDSHAQEAYVAKYLKEMPYLRGVFFTIRTFFSMRNFNNVFTGGLGSYGIFILIVAVLQRHSPKHTGSRRALSSSSLEYEAIRNFFAALAPGRLKQHMKIDLTNLGLSCFPRSRFKKHDPHPDLNKYIVKANDRGDRVRAGQWRIGQKNEWLPDLLCLQDPANPNNDLGRKTYAIKHILASMNSASYAFRQGLLSKSRDPESPGESVLTPYIGRPHEVYHDQRVKLEHYGLVLKRRKNHAKMYRQRANRRAAKEAGEEKAEEMGPRGADESLVRKVEIGEL